MLTKRFGSLRSQSKKGVVSAAVATVTILIFVLIVRTVQSQSDLYPPPKYFGSRSYSFTIDSVNTVDENDRLVYYIVRFTNDSTNSEYEVLGSIAPDQPPLFCAENALFCVEYDSTCTHFIVVPVETLELQDTVLSLCISTIYWIPGRLGYQFRLQDSILTFEENSPDPSVRRRSLICRIKPGRTCDTVAIIEDTRYPAISDDGTEVFLLTMTDFPNADSTASDSTHFSMSIYDLVADSLIVPFPSDWQVVDLSRTNRNSPLFYVRIDSNRVSSDVWVVKDSEHFQVTQLDSDEYAGDFIIEGDSLICQAYKSGRPRRYRRVTVELK